MRDFTEIDLKELFFALLYKSWLIVLCALIAGGLSYLYTDNFITPMYRASVSIYVNNTTPALEGSSYISGGDLATAQRLVSTYVNIIKSNTVLEKVVEKSGLDISKEAVRGMMAANPVENTEIFEIHISSADPERAALVANAIAEVAPDEIANFLEGSSTKIIDYAEVPQFRYTPSYRKNVFLGLVVGAGLACVYIVLRTILDVRIKSEEDLERLFELPVLGTIPEFGAGHKGGKYGHHRYGYSGYCYGERPAKGGKEK